MIRKIGIILFLGCVFAAIWGNEAQGKAKKIKIGLSMDSLRVGRWRKNRDIFKKRAEELGAEVFVQNADSDTQRQNNQADNLITQKADVLVVIAKDGRAASYIVEATHQKGIKVLAYDRLILDSDADTLHLLRQRTGRVLADRIYRS